MFAVFSNITYPRALRRSAVHKVLLLTNILYYCWVLLTVFLQTHVCNSCYSALLILIRDQYWTNIITFELRETDFFAAFPHKNYNKTRDETPVL